MRLHLALISSNTSGFFLCGMMLLPVVNSDGNEIKPKFWLIYKQASMARRPKVPATPANAVPMIFSVLPRLIWAYTEFQFNVLNCNSSVVRCLFRGNEEP